MKELFLLCTAVAAVSWLLTQSELLGGFRRWVRKRWIPLGKLFDCYYCMAHWIAFIFVGAFDVNIVRTFWPLSWLLSVLIVAWIATLLNAMLDKLWTE